MGKILVMNNNEYHSRNSFAAKPPPGINTPLASSVMSLWLPWLPLQLSSLLSSLVQSNVFSNESPSSLSKEGVVRYRKGFLGNQRQEMSSIVLIILSFTYSNKYDSAL